MKRPAFQFYPADWRKDPALSACSLAARGLWIELICIAHESERYGHLDINGKPMTPAQLARMVGELPATVAKLLSELEDAGVFSRDEQGCIYSRRMVADERIRNVRSDAGRLGGNPNLVKQKVDGLLKQNEEQNLTPSSSSSSSSSESAIALSARDPDDPNTPTPEPPTTRAGAVCRRMKAAGLTAVNPAHPKLAALLAAGITDAELEAAAADAAQRGKGFAYALAAAEGQRRDAAVEPLPDRASITVPSRAGPDPALQRLEADRAAWKPPAPEVKAMLAQTAERLKARVA